MCDDDLVTLEVRGAVAKLTLNRPQAHNALNTALIDALAERLRTLDADDAVSVILLAGTGRHFAAGADIREMSTLDATAMVADDFAGCCTVLAEVSKPVIALVHGAALGGGCELVEMCDMVIAADSALFGHPEVTLATMPGAGGTQRLMRAVGKAMAMRLLLTGQPIDAATALASGLVSQVVPAAELEATGWTVAARVASFPLVTLRCLKEAALLAHETPLREGLPLERRLFHRTFVTPERQEGMAAFLDKRPPAWAAPAASPEGDAA